MRKNLRPRRPPIRRSLLRSDSFIRKTAEQSRVIGHISAVNSEVVTIELGEETPGYVKAMSSGIAQIGAINTYVSISVGLAKIMAVVTAIRVLEQPMSGNDLRSIGQSTQRVLEATMIGRIEGAQYRPGIAAYPPLYAPVSAATATEVARIFKAFSGPQIRLGEAVVAPGQDVLLHADTLLGRHCAVLGSTGSGKSCSVVAILNGLLELDIPSASIVIFDANGEYASAFAQVEHGERFNVCVIGGLDDKNVDLLLPHWFMDNAEHISLFQAGEGVQAPLLQQAVAEARLSSVGGQEFASRVLLYAKGVDANKQLLNNTTAKKIQEAVSYGLHSLSDYAAQQQAITSDDTSSAEFGFWSDVATAFKPVDLQRLKFLSGYDAFDKPLTPEQRETTAALLDEVGNICAGALGKLGLGTDAISSDFDAPRYYSLESLAQTYLPNRIEKEAMIEPRVRGYASTMQMRINRYLSDARYNFFTRNGWFDNALGAFLRLLLGWDPGDSTAPWAAQYHASMGNDVKRHAVTILDLSAVSPEILEHVAALVARIIMDFCQRLRPRASLPVMLVLEEAHRYVPAATNPKSLRPAEVFERIAKEGRKYGVSLLLATQRPAELSRTVLAQCGTLVAHRIVNADDQEIIRHATPFAGRDVLRQLPGLATQHAIVIGEAVPAPTYVRIQDVANRPRSRDPHFIGEWGKPPSDDVAVRIDEVAAEWERGSVIASAKPSEDFEVPF